MAADRLVPLIYDDLRRIAARAMRHERRDHTLQPTALVNEAYLRLIDQRRVAWQNRAHFFGVAARIMRRLLVDHARRGNSQKRGGSGIRVTLDEGLVAAGPRPVDLIDLDRALAALAEAAPHLGRLAELRFFTGLEVAEAAELLGVSVSTAERQWRTARAFLHRELTREPER